MKKESFKEKQARILTAMAAKEILDAVKDAAKVLKQAVNIGPDPGLKMKIFLFYFKGKYHLIQEGIYKKLDESEVGKTLEKYSETKIYFMCSDNSICPMPSVLTGKEKEAVQVKDDQAAINYIKTVSGIEIKLSDL